MKRETRKIALTIAGSDSGGGAGIQADLKTFAAFGVHGTSAISCLTAQNPIEVLAVEPVSPNFLTRQLEAVFSELPPDAVKTGMLYSKPLIDVVVRFWKGSKSTPPLIIDRVMVSTSGHALLKPAAKMAMIHELFPMATLVTPNLDEANTILNCEINDVEQLRSAGKEIFNRYGCPVLMKGGHFSAMKEAVDVYYDGKEELLLSSPFIRGVSTHGTGCTYSAAITAAIAKGKPLAKAVQAAKSYISATIAQSYKAARHDVLNHEPS